MSHTFKVYHRPVSMPAEVQWPEGYFALQTCLRTVVVTECQETHPILNGFEVYTDHQAYAFLLEVICGMHSPLVGETEIFGQFKTYLNTHRTHFSSGLNQVMENLTKETKRIRFEYLQNLGCTSYGSLLRKTMGEKKGFVTLLGAGALTVDLLPWLSKGEQKPLVFTRQPSRYSELKQQFTGLEILPIHDFLVKSPGKGVLVIAAGFSAEALEPILKNQNFDVIYDLRGESTSDPLALNNVIQLKDLFEDLEKNRKQVKEVKETVAEVIHRYAQEFKLLERQRPFGWEDLWTYS